MTQPPLPPLPPQGPPAGQPPVPPRPPAQPPFGQPPFGQPPYPPAPPAPRARPRNGLGIAALILGIVAFVGAFIPFFNWVSIAIAVAGLIVGIIALTRSGRPKAAAGVGTGLSVVALILSVILAIAYTVVFVHIWNNQQNIDTRPGAGTTEIPLVYQAGGTSHSATITYTTYDGVRSSTEQSTDAQLPFEKDLTTETGGAATYLSYTLTVTNGSDGGDVSCRIILDGTTIAEQHSSGAYTTASCTASGTQILK